MAWLAAQRSTRVLVRSFATGHTDISDALVVFQLLRKSAWWTGLTGGICPVSRTGWQMASEDVLYQVASPRLDDLVGIFRNSRNATFSESSGG